MQFIKTSVIGGLVVIVPMAIISFVVGDAINTLVAVTKPLTTNLPFPALISTIIAAAIVIVIVVAICFTTGYLVNTILGTTIKNWLETNLLERVPMYSTLRSLTQQFAGIKDADFPVVEADLYNSDSRVLGILIENLPDDRQVIYIPISPLVTVGQVHILPKNRVTVTNLSMVETLGCISQMGIDVKKLYKK